MANYSLHAYDADVWIPSFTGLNQYGAGDSVDTRFATEAVNVETPGGVLQPAAALQAEAEEFQHFAGTLARFYRRWAENEDEKEVLVIAENGQIRYTHNLFSQSLSITLPEGIDSFQSDRWSCVTYEINIQDVDHPVDVLIISNPVDGVFMIVPPDKPYTWGDVHEQNWGYYTDGTWEDIRTEKWALRTVDTRANPDDDEEPQKKFAFIERYNERIWGGGWAENPDTLYYSRPYAADDWTAPGVGEEPENGAGEITQPSWDGDRFTALKRFGDNLIAFKENHVWRITGTDPSSFYFAEQFGGGCPYPETIVVDDERILFAERDGLSYYDGASVNPFNRQYIEKLWDKVNKSALGASCAVMVQDRYYLSVPTWDSETNSAMIIYNKVEGSFLQLNTTIESMEVFRNSLKVAAGVKRGVLLYDSWKTGQVQSDLSRWVSPWIDFGYKRIVKGGFDFYFTPEVQDTAVTFTVYVQTEKKTKVKNYTVQTLTEEAKAAGKQHKAKRLHFSGTGRRFRVVVETPAGSAPWRLTGGIQMVVETDPD